MFSGEQIASLLAAHGVTHVVTVPDGTLGSWEPAIQREPALRLVRVCREGEAWGVAAGLYMGGARPVVMIQCTGLFESGDALRNVVHEWKLPIFSIIGYRSYLGQAALPGDTCLVFTEPVLSAWKIPFALIAQGSDFDRIAERLERCIADGVATAVLVAEGRG
jgi:sulfopyruvate decarboxylase TPP-binding subunit